MNIGNKVEEATSTGEFPAVGGPDTINRPTDQVLPRAEVRKPTHVYAFRQEGVLVAEDIQTAEDYIRTVFLEAIDTGPLTGDNPMDAGSHINTLVIDTLNAVQAISDDFGDDTVVVELIRANVWRVRGTANTNASLENALEDAERALAAPRGAGNSGARAKARRMLQQHPHLSAALFISSGLCEAIELTDPIEISGRVLSMEALPLMSAVGNLEINLPNKPKAVQGARSFYIPEKELTQFAREFSTSIRAMCDAFAFDVAHGKHVTIYGHSRSSTTIADYNALVHEPSTPTLIEFAAVADLAQVALHELTARVPGPGDAERARIAASKVGRFLKGLNANPIASIVPMSKFAGEFTLDRIVESDPDATSIGGRPKGVLTMLYRNYRTYASAFSCVRRIETTSRLGEVRYERVPELSDANTVSTEFANILDLPTGDLLKDFLLRRVSEMKPGHRLLTTCTPLEQKILACWFSDRMTAERISHTSTGYAADMSTLEFQFNKAPEVHKKGLPIHGTDGAWRSKDPAVVLLAVSARKGSEFVPTGGSLALIRSLSDAVFWKELNFASLAGPDNSHKREIIVRVTGKNRSSGENVTMKVKVPYEALTLLPQMSTTLVWNTAFHSDVVERARQVAAITCLLSGEEFDAKAYGLPGLPLFAPIGGEIKRVSEEPDADQRLQALFGEDGQSLLVLQHDYAAALTRAILTLFSVHTFQTAIDLASRAANVTLDRPVTSAQFRDRAAMYVDTVDGFLAAIPEVRTLYHTLREVAGGNTELVRRVAIDMETRR